MENSSPAGQKLLACVALSPRVHAVAAEALALGRALGMELSFVHAGEDSAGVRGTLEEAIRSSLAPGESMPALHIEEGRPDDVACSVAVRVDADLIVAGALEKEGLFEGLLGTTGRRIARSAPCSVLLLPEPVDAGTRFGTIVVSTKYDDRSREMLDYVAELARLSTARSLHIVAEFDLYGVSASNEAIPSQPGGEAPGATWAIQERVALSSFLDSVDLHGVEVELACLEGREGTQSVEYAQTQGADLLVVPAPPRRLTVLDRFFNHPTEFALHRLPCALLLYRHPRLEPDPAKETTSR